MDDVENEKFTRTQVNQELLKEYVGGKVKNFNSIFFSYIYLSI